MSGSISPARDGGATVLTAYIEMHTKLGAHGMREPLCAPRIECADGFSVSVQAGRTHYCLPRDMKGPWTHFECGMPTMPVPEWLEWRDGDDPDTENVFGYVPGDVILATIQQHGGCAALAVCTPTVSP